jgi:predicted aldo/keto reductase-like oxidoreductase
MKYRAFGKMDWRPSALGFGCMRFPRREDRTIDQDKVTPMLRYAVDHGVNYFDTAHAYSGSEESVGKALAGGYRERVKIATKLPVWEIKGLDEADRIFDEQLARLQTGHVDFYLLHSLNGPVWDRIKDMGLFEWAEKKMAAGAIGHLGFSYHGGLDSFKEIVDAYDAWTFCQLQLNYIDVEYETGLEGPRYAHQKGLGLVIMEPLRGGLLATPPNDEIKAMFERAHIERTPADWALRWLWNRPEVSTVLSGMTTMENLLENIESAQGSGVGELMPKDQAFVLEVGRAIRSKMTIPCTACGYCLPCPSGINIPEYFGYYNAACTTLPDRSRLDRLAAAFQRWPAENRPDQCSACGTCAPRCPQGIDIPVALDKFLRDIGARQAEAV